VGLGREKGARYGPTTYLDSECGVTELRTYKVTFIYKHNTMRINSELKVTNLLPIYHGVKGTSAGSGPRSGHCREAMAPGRVGPGMGQPIGVTTEGW
jgi:hypothetical protein